MAGHAYTLRQMRSDTKPNGIRGLLDGVRMNPPERLVGLVQPAVSTWGQPVALLGDWLLAWPHEARRC